MALFRLVVYLSKIELVVNGKKVPLNKFTNNVLNDILLAFLKNLRNVEISEITKVEIS